MALGLLQVVVARPLAESAAAAKAVVDMAVVQLLEATTVMHPVAVIAEHAAAFHTAA